MPNLIGIETCLFSIFFLSHGREKPLQICNLSVRQSIKQTALSKFEIGNLLASLRLHLNQTEKEKFWFGNKNSKFPPRKKEKQKITRTPKLIF